MEFENDKMVKKAIRGNKKAFEQLIKQYYERIYRTAYLYVHNEEDALDVVQEATYQTFTSIHSLKHPEYFMTWLTKIIIRCAGQILKKRNNIVPLTDEVLSNLTVDYHSGHDEAINLLNVIGQLRGNYQSAIILFYYYDYSIKTISEIMEIPEGTVKTYLSRGRAELKKSYKEEEGKCNG
ncbi:sigma-70 family RNA polymerase sigma factor [Metabacillus rhizolycopersici]|uniref:Sigma-70 family RNA polymerase sigma factor n=1 Tax=Metabacillus rhizolycopersici TaxID=2875709 RepID=A0ABS7UMS5_9BACI|nr:sigma-70 family RNA polymerase sigma factor [Metabacillus rhizolycopersici]MBZ5749610.1 sigma-70 family RNA polymerase sigma factor [Metabacillus rhizolycopersici]